MIKIPWSSGKWGSLTFPSEVLHVKGQGQLRLLVKRAPHSTDRLDPLELAQ